MVTSKQIEEGLVVIKTTMISMLLGLMMAYTVPALGVTESLPSFLEAEAAPEAKKPAWYGRAWGWTKDKTGAIVTGTVQGVQNWSDPGKKNATLKAQKKELEARILVLQDKDVKKQAGSQEEIDALKGCAVSFTTYLNTLEPDKVKVQ